MLTQDLEASKSLNASNSNSILSWEEIRERLRNPLTLPAPVNLHLIRHAQSKVNADKRVTGAQDVDLTPLGEEQATSLGSKLLPYYHVAFTSTLKRAQKTLELALEGSNTRVEDILRDSRLNERSLGSLEGQEWRWIPEYAYGDLKYAPEGGESYEEVAKRILSFLIELSDRLLEHPIHNVLISSHMGPMRIMAGILTEQEDSATVLSFTFSNTEVVELTWNRLIIPGFLRVF